MKYFEKNSKKLKLSIIRLFLVYSVIIAVPLIVVMVITGAASYAIIAMAGALVTSLFFMKQQKSSLMNQEIFVDDTHIAYTANMVNNVPFTVSIKYEEISKIVYMPNIPLFLNERIVLMNKITHQNLFVSEIYNDFDEIARTVIKNCEEHNPNLNIKPSIKKRFCKKQSGDGSVIDPDKR